MHQKMGRELEKVRSRHTRILACAGSVWLIASLVAWRMTAYGTGSAADQGYAIAAGAVALVALLCAAAGTGWLMGGRAAARRTDARGRPAGRTPEPRAVRPAGAETGAGFSRIMDALDGISDGFVLWDEHDRLLMHNQTTILGESPELAAKIRSAMAFRDYLGTVYPLIDPRTSGGSIEAWIAKREAWHASADGSHEVLLVTGRWTLISERRTSDGATVTIYTDITERKNAERLLKQSERRLSHAQRLAKVGTWEWDARSARVYWSDLMYEIVGLPLGSPPPDLDQYYLLVHPAHRDVVRSTFKRLITIGGQYNQEYRIIRPDGEIRTLRTEAEAILDDHGCPVRVVGAVHDMTDLKRAEQALRSAKEAADHANRAKSEFLANVSHELRTPLNAILGFSEVMIQEVFGPVGNERYREYAIDIQQSGSHLLSVINDLLDYSKLEAGRLELHLEEVAVADIVEKSLRLMRNQAASKQVALTAASCPAATTIAADDRKIMQIMLNLLSNAIKYTPAGGSVSISAAEAGGCAEISVADTGIGMSDEDIAVALAPFGQVDTSLNRQQTGTGLGLPLSRALAELHGGALTIESEAGAGTTIRLRLPLAAAPPADRTLRLVSGGQAG